MKVFYRTLAVIVGIIFLWSALVGISWLSEISIHTLTFKEKLLPITWCVALITWLVGLVVVVVLLIEKGD